MKRSTSQKFPVFYSLMKRRLRSEDLSLLLALFPRLYSEIQSGHSIQKALDRASRSTASGNYGILLDLAAGQISFQPASPARPSDVISHRTAALRKLEKDLRRLLKEGEKALPAPKPFEKLENLL